MGDPVNSTDPSGLEPPICMVDGTSVPCSTASTMIGSGAGVRAPLNTTRFDPDANMGRGEWQFYRAYASGDQGWYNNQNESISAFAGWFTIDYGYDENGNLWTWFRISVTTNSGSSTASSPVLGFILPGDWAGDGPRPQPRQWYAKPETPRTTTPRTTTPFEPPVPNNGLDGSKKITVERNLQDEYNQVRGPRPLSGWRGFWQGVGNLLGPGVSSADFFGPIIWTPEIECAVLKRKCGIPG